MHITKVELQNFKRFTNLTIDGIPADTKLVLLIAQTGRGSHRCLMFNSASKVDTSRVSRSGQRGIDLALSTRVGNRVKMKDEAYGLSITTDSEMHMLSFSELPDPLLSGNSFYQKYLMTT